MFRGRYGRKRFAVFPTDMDLAQFSGISAVSIKPNRIITEEGIVLEGKALTNVDYSRLIPATFEFDGQAYFIGKGDKHIFFEPLFEGGADFKAVQGWIIENIYLKGIKIPEIHIKGEG